LEKQFTVSRMGYCFGLLHSFSRRLLLLFFFPDASSTGCAAFIQGSATIVHRNWSLFEFQKSSVWRELAAVKFALEAFDTHLSDNSVRWNTDSQNVVRIVQIGSMIDELQELALDTFRFTFHLHIQLGAFWIPRDQNSKVDIFSKITDFADYSVLISYLKLKRSKSWCLALCIDFDKLKRNSWVGFCTSLSGLFPFATSREFRKVFCDYFCTLVPVVPWESPGDGIHELMTVFESFLEVSFSDFCFH